MMAAHEKDQCQVAKLLKMEGSKKCFDVFRTKSSAGEFYFPGNLVFNIFRKKLFGVGRDVFGRFVWNVEKYNEFE